MKQILCVLLAVLMIVFCAACSKEPELSAAPTSAPTVPATEETPALFSIGDSVVIDEVILTYVDNCVGWQNYLSILPPKEGYQYVQATFEVEYTGEFSAHVSHIEFSCYADDYECEYVYQGIGDMSATLSSGRKSTGSVFFLVPLEATEIEIEYHHDGAIAIFKVQ